MRSRTRVILSLSFMAGLGVCMFFVSALRVVQPEVSGWCCLKAQGVCSRGYSLTLCNDSRGRVFSADAVSCDAACLAFPADAEDPRL